MVVPAKSAERERGVLEVVTVSVKNTGSRAGKEIVQLYVGELDSRLPRLPKELRHFAKVSLDSGESKSVRFAQADVR